jgi:hypothetical protein
VYEIVVCKRKALENFKFKEHLTMTGVLGEKNPIQIKLYLLDFCLHNSNSETFSSKMHLRYQKEQNIDLKLLRFNPDLGGKQENL